MIARCLVLACLLCLPSGAQEQPTEDGEAKAKEERALVEKQLFPLLQEADEVVLYSLFPLPRTVMSSAEHVEAELASYEGLDRGAELSRAEKRVAGLAMKGDIFHGYPILGKIEIKSAEERVKVLGELRAAVRTKEESRSVGTCFTPRHGVLVRKGQQRLSFVICFECKRVHIEGLPEVAKEAGEVLKRFDEDLRAKLNARFDATGIARSPYKDHPARAPETLP